jgi:hypothetical protein
MNHKSVWLAVVGQELYPEGGTMLRDKGGRTRLHTTVSMVRVSVDPGQAAG